MLLEEIPKADEFRRKLRDSLLRETLGSQIINVARHDYVYVIGDKGDTIYFIESGQIKLLMVSTEERSAF